MASRPARTQEDRNRSAKEAISKAALELTALNGFERTTLAEIGMRAGFSRGIVSYHFGTKSELAQHLLHGISERSIFLESLRIDQHTSGEEALRSLDSHLADSWAYFASLGRDGGLTLAERGELLLGATALFSVDPALRDTIDEYVTDLRARVGAVIARAIRDSAIRPAVDPQATALFYVYSIWGLANALVCSPQDRDLISGSVDMLRDFIRSLQPCDTTEIRP